MSGWVYLLHFSQPITAAPRGPPPCRHYMGSASDLWARIAQHRAGKAGALWARLTEVAHERGIGFVVAYIWPVPAEWTPRQLERQLKRRKNAPKLCPICSGREPSGREPLFLKFTLAASNELAF